MLRRVTAEFQPYELAEALLALDRYCATHPRDPHGIGGSDELLEAIVHLARGDLNRLRRTIHYARTGPGDILLAAFGRS